MSQLDDDSLDQEPLSSSPEYSGEESDLSMTADAFAHGCDSVSISSFTSDRLKPGQEDTASLVSTATLVPECIYIPPVGYQLLSEQEFMQQKLALQNVSEQLEKVTNEKDALQEALRCSSEDCSNRVMLLMDQIKNSEELLQNLQKTLVDSQQKTTCQMGSLLASFGRLCKDVSSLNEENNKLRALSCTGSPNEQRQAASHTPLQREAQHRQERLCIEIVTLQEELNASLGEKSDLEEQLKRERETHTEDREIMEATLSSLRTEVDRIQQERKQTELQLQESEGQVQKLWESLSDQEKCLQEEREEKASLKEALDEERTKVLRLQAELGTSEDVQRDFVRLSQSLQVSLEKIRQADSMKDIQEILENTRLTNISQLGDV